MTNKPFVSLLFSIYNEAPILQNNLQEIIDFTVFNKNYDWEIILVDDGSQDLSASILHQFSAIHKNIKVLHHKKNKGLGRGLQTGIDQTLGDIVVTLDIDLSISLEHVPKMLAKLQETEADVVIVSPTLQEGTMSNVPWHRHFLSKCANHFLSFFCPVKISNLTAMSRAYKGTFLRSLELRAQGMEIMPEILYKTLIMNGSIEEIPGSLKWNIAEKKQGRKSKMRIFAHTLATLFSGFLLRPVFFFIFPGILLAIFASYSTTWMFIHLFSAYPDVAGNSTLDRLTNALALAYQLHPHTFLVALASIILSIQLFAIGFFSLQNKHYYEEMFYLITRANLKKGTKER